MSLISLLFEPRTISFPLIEREIVQKFNASQSRALYLMAPEGMGKTTAALSYYMKWSSAKIWLNVTFLHGHYQPLAVLRDELVLRGLISSAMNDNEGCSPAQLAAALSEQQAPLLLVFDGFAERHNSLLLEELYQLIPMLPDHVRLVLTAHSRISMPPSSLLSSAKVQKFSVEELCFTNAEVEKMFDEEIHYRPEIMELVRSCEGWPALLRLLQQLPLDNMSFAQVEQVLFDFIAETLPKMVSDDVLKCMIKLSYNHRFNGDLCRRLGGIEPAHIEQMRQAGLVKYTHIGAHCSGFRWRNIVLRAVRDRMTEPTPDLATAQQYLDWADANPAWAEALNYAIHLETAEQLQQRIIRDGFAVQERGNAPVLRMACDLVAERQPELSQQKSFIWVDLVSCWHSDVSKIKERISMVRQRKGICATNPSQLDILEAQLALSDSDYQQAEELVSRLETSKTPMNEYFKLQKISIQGELAIHKGYLDKALQLFRTGEDLARRLAYPSSLLWHLHQQCQVLRLKGQSSVAEHKRFLAIQFAREQNFTHLVQYEYLLHAKCEQYLSEIRVNEARSVVQELERRLQQSGEMLSLPVASLKLELHRLSCIVSPAYRCNIQPVTQIIEQQMIQGCHVYQRVRAESRLLSFWQQTQQWHSIAQWYNGAQPVKTAPENVEQLIHLRNLIFANQSLSYFGLSLDLKWPENLPEYFAFWIETWPAAAYATIGVWALQQEDNNPKLSVCWLLNSISGFSQMNELSEPLAFNPDWLDVIGRTNVKVRRIQASFISRLHALWGNRVKSRAVQRKSSSQAEVQRTGLSPREQQVLEFLSNGMTNDTIAEHLNLSLGTVKNLLTQVYRKLGVSGRRAASHRYKSLAME